MSKYNETVKALKLVARDSLRMDQVSLRQTRIDSVNKDIKNLNDVIAETTKHIAIAQFQQSEVKDNDPQKDEKIADYVEHVKELNEELVELATYMTKHTDALKTIEDEIAEIEAGKKLVDLDKLNALTANLILEVTKQAALVAVEALA